MVIPVHRGEAFLRETILSVLEQGVAVQVLCVSGPEDRSREVVADLPLRWVFSEENGIALSLNRALSEVKSEFVCFLDQDDLLLPGSLQCRVSGLVQNPHEMTVMGENGDLIDAEGRRLDRLSAIVRRRWERVPERLSFSYILEGGWVPLSPLSLMCFRTAWVKSLGGFDPSYRRAQDRDFFYRILLRGEVSVLRSPVLLYRVHEKNASLRRVGDRLEMAAITKAEWLLLDRCYGIKSTTF